jgi:hypothetical protein
VVLRILGLSFASSGDRSGQRKELGIIVLVFLRSCGDGNAWRAFDCLRRFVGWQPNNYVVPGRYPGVTEIPCLLFGCYSCSISLSLHWLTDHYQREQGPGNDELSEAQNSVIRRIPNERDEGGWNGAECAGVLQ